MARLTWTGWLGVVGLCLMLTLAFLPKTKWLMKLHGYVATGQLKIYGKDPSDHGTGTTSDIDQYELLRLIAPSPEADRKTELAHAILTKFEPDGERRKERLAQLSAKYPEDPLVQAVACRYFSTVVFPRPNTIGTNRAPERIRQELAKQQRIYAQLADIANRGIAADPDNLYFDIILACAKCGQQKIDEAREIIRQATKKHSYNEYSWEECGLLTDMMKGSNDSGSYLRLQVYSNLIFPYYVAMKTMSIWLSQTGTEEQKEQSRLDLLIIANTAANKVDTLIGILVMRAITSIALVGTAPHELGEKPTNEAYLAAIDRLQPLADARFPRGSSPDLRTIYDRSNRLAQAIAEYSDEIHRMVTSSDPRAYPASPFAKMKLSLGFLLIVVFLIPAALMHVGGQRLRKHAGAARALPLLVPIFIALLTQEFGEVLTGPNYTSLMALSIAGLSVAFVLAWFERFAKISLWIAMGVSAVGLLYGAFVAIVGYTPFSWTLLTAVATLAAVFASRDFGPQWARNALSGVLILAAAGVASLNLALSQINNTEWVISIVILVLAAAVGPMLPNSGRRIVGPCILAASVVFALQCRQMVAIDKQADLVAKTFKTEAQQIREMAAKMP